MSASEVVNGLLNDLYPGEDPAVVQVRKDLARVSAIPGPAVVLLEGPPGSGKTAMARTIAVCRRLLTGSPPGFLPTMEQARQEVLSQKPLTWYRDMSLAGLVEGLADAQLFGVGEKVATEVMPRIGIFEQAMTGHDPSEPVGTHDELVRAAMEKHRWAPLVTGGLVLLDEIGDLPIVLQAKLLRVLNGEKQYRLGKEGNDAFSFQFCGVTILATWRDLAAKEEFRRDLWERICHNRIRVPSLSSYSIENRARIVRWLSFQFQQQTNEELARLHRLGEGAKSDVCSSDWLVRLARIAKQGLSAQSELELSRLDWGLLGEFRGLRNVVFRVMLGSRVEEAVESVHRSGHGRVQVEPSTVEQDLAILRRVLCGSSVSAGWKQRRLEWARRINAQLLRRDHAVEDVIEASAKSRKQVKKEIENLLRSESRDSSLGAE